jgi:hypothetical protein
MTEFNFYPVFVADQVLTADHLNEIVNYLDEQDRLTRNKLIGIGIVCGLELKVSDAEIQITKGCGVTSEGYLIVQDQVALTYYRPYTLPADFYPKYKPVYEPWHMWELVTTEQSLEFEDVEAIKEHKAFMRDKIVVLLLEMKETPLKNCIDTDCDDKGEKIQFAVKPILVSKRDIDAFLKSVAEHVVDEPNLFEDAKMHEIELKRFNVPVTQLTSTDVLLNAFLQLVDDTTLKRLSEVLNYCYVHYKPILFEETSNPFNGVFETLKNRLAAIKTYNPFFIQYYYDWIDDIIKAYYEFKSKVFDVQMMCCPEENLFPLHLMLGEATKSTSAEVKTKYRNYFIYSPLFNQQKELLAEVQLLFRRMKLLIQNYGVPNANTLPNALVKITPSKYLDRPLSDRCIPYYYNPTTLYKSWSWSKTRKGNARYNLSYNANQYNSSDAVVNPLKYDIERFNFFRVEGHIGKTYTQALSNVIGQRNQYNLPFEVVALSTATVARYMAHDDKECLFKDLDSLYQVILAELICRFGDVACMIADVPYTFQFLSTVGMMETVGNVSGALFNAAAESEHIHANVASEAMFSNLSSSLLAVNLATITAVSYKKGDFIRKHCAIKKGSVGEVYLNLIAKGHSFIKPAPTAEINLNTVYAHLFYFIDCVENIMGASWPYELKDFVPATFTSRFSAVTEESRFIATNTGAILKAADKLNLEDVLRRFPALIHTCFDERFEALKKEYQKRQAELQALVNFMNYFKKHPGMEHKAGVPKGGTFILVYHETPPRKPIRFNADLLASANVPGALSIAENVKVKAASMVNLEGLLSEASVKDPELLKRFHLALTKFVDTCNDMDDNTKDEITDVLINIPTLNLPSKFNIPEYAVVADFYLPYLCCSDCAPITYILPKEPVGVLSIGIQPTEFCNDDDKAYPVTASPEGGSLSASAGGVESGKLEFRPKGLKAGVNKLTYTVPDGRSTSVDVKIVEAFRTDFKFEIQPDGITVKFYLGTSGQKATWNFGDGVIITTDEKELTHTYQFGEDEKQFTVKLTAPNGPCIATAEQTFTLKKPLKAEFGIIPRLFCYFDKTSYSFNTSPTPKSIKEIKNDDKLIISRDASSGAISFIPANQKLTDSKDFTLNYQSIPLGIRIVVPNANFFMKLSRIQNGNDVDVILHIEAKQTDADAYKWIVKVRDRELSFSNKAEDISYRHTEISLEDELLVALAVRYNIPGVRCQDSREFVITREIFKRFLDKDQFDNDVKI